MADTASPEPWILAIDFGTSFTVAAARRSNRAPEVIEIDGERRVPSVVLVDASGKIAIGRAAESLATNQPDRVLRTPKNRLGVPTSVVLGGRAYPIVDLVGALLAYVYREAIRSIGSAPGEVRLTYPASWSAPRRDELLAAANRAALPKPVLVPEPLAAAIAYADEVAIAPGSHVLVYDLGGGTFDSAALRAEGPGFVVVGRPIGDANLGGELFDELVLNHIGAKLDPAVWDQLQVSDDHLWELAAASLRGEARRIKEVLTSHPEAEALVALPTGIVSIRMTRSELDQLVRPYIQESIEVLTRCATDAGLRKEDLAAVYLVGGASRSPIVAEMVGAVFPNVALSRRGDPKAAVAIGATHPGIDVSRVELRVSNPGQTTAEVAAPTAPILPAPPAAPPAPTVLAPPAAAAPPAPAVPVPARATVVMPPPAAPLPPPAGPVGPSHPPRPARPAWPWVLAVSALVAAVLGGVLITRGGGDGGGARPSSSTTSAVSTATVIASSAPPSSVINAIPPTTLPPAALGEFAAIAPARIVDTRNGEGVPQGRAEKVQQLAVSVAGRVPVDKTKSVVLNVSVAEPTAAGYLTIYPTGTPPPDVSQIAFSGGRVASSLVITRLNAAGQFDLRFSNATAHLLVDLVGYFTSSPTQGALSVVPEPRPVRLLDTRSASPITPNGTIELTLPEGQKGALLGVTATRARNAGFLTAYSGAARPPISNVNFSPSVDATALTLVASADRKVRVYNGSPGTVDVIVYQVAKLTDSSAGALTLNVNSNGVSTYPFRTFDSRSKNVICAASLGGGVTNISSIFPKAKALLVSVTAINATADSFMQIYAGDSAPPDVAALNFEAGEQRSNLVFVPIAGDRINVLCGGGSPQYLLDVLAEFN